MAGEHVSERWAKWRDDVSLEEYHTRWTLREEAGQSTHGEADLIVSFGPRTVLDAGCGMGRVAMELHRRGIHVVGADLDGDLLAYAAADEPAIPWHHADLATLDLGQTFDLVAMPGNVMLFCRPDDRASILRSLAAHLRPGGLLVAGFGVDPARGGLALPEYDDHAGAAGLHLAERFSTWERDPFDGAAHDYAVSVHRR